MNFEFSEEQRLIRDQARKFLDRECDTATVRAVLEGEQFCDRALWDSVAEPGGVTSPRHRLDCPAMELTVWVHIAAVSFVLFYVLAIVSAIEAILKARTSQGAIAWVISLFTFPLVAVPLYLILGRSRFAGYLEQREAVQEESRLLLEEAQSAVAHYALPATAERPLYASLLKLVLVPPTTGNAVQLLIDGRATFDSIEQGLRGAQQYILFQSYILREDDLGRRVARILSDKAREGLRVCLLFDEIGSPRFARSKLCRQLRQTGVRVAPFNTTQGRRNRFQLNFRNHRKIVVVDGLKAWVGGHNVGDEYLGKSRRFGPWRDTHISLEGPAVRAAELVFATDWHWATQGTLDLDWPDGLEARGTSEVLLFPSDPAGEYEEAGLMYHQIIVAARQRIWIASPYFVPDNAIISALQLAALRGVDVRILVPDKTDGVIVGLANWSFIRQLLPVGVRFYRYREGFMHQKVLLMDDELAGVGTANFDNRSFRLNFELTALVRDPKFAREVEQMLKTDMMRSRQVDLDEARGKPAWFVLATAAARLLAPVL